jgi:hypothetical protein
LKKLLRFFTFFVLVKKCDFFELGDYIPNIFFTRGRLALSTKPHSPFTALLRLLLPSKRWLWFARGRLILPLPVTLKRFFALECVLIFGIMKILFFKMSRKGNANYYFLQIFLKIIERKKDLWGNLG